MHYTINEIATIIQSKNNPLNESSIHYLLTDSRSLLFPETTLFFALKTRQNNGHKYIKELYEKNVRNFIVCEAIDSEAFPKATFLFVEDTLKALQRLTAYHRSQFEIPIVGITGSNGKTVVKEWLYQLTNDDMQVVRSPRSYNSQSGVPLSVWLLNKHTDLGVFEAGISEKDEMACLETIIKPKICILTNIGEAHQENFSSLEEKCLEKLRLAKNCDLLICNTDNEIICKCINELNINDKIFSWSRIRQDASLFISSVEKKDTSSKITGIYQERENEFTIPFTDDASIENAVNCFAAMILLDAPEEKIKERMQNLEPVAMRLEVLSGKNGCTLINDSYNSDVYSLDIALDFQFRRDAEKKMKHTLILSDVMQSGMSPDALCRKIAELIRMRKIDKFIGIGKELSSHKNYFTCNEQYFYDSTSNFIHSGDIKNSENELILLKGARSFHFEHISDLLEQKVHETILEVDLNAVVHNFNYYRSHLLPQTQMICMVKASAYGAGSYEIAKTLQAQRCDYLAVAVADEGAGLRKNGITIPIMVMNPEMSAFRTIFDYRLEPEIYSFRLLEAFIKEADKHGIFNYPVHIKIDTGMHRLGFSSDEITRLGSILNEQQNLVVRSVFSHLAGSDEEELNDFTEHQIDLFTDCCNQFDAITGQKPLRHILNSEGIIRFPETQMNMVRLGLGLYGINSGGGLKNISTLRTTILQIRTIPVGETVGYGRKGLVNRTSRIATLPIGYADGLNRKLGNGRAGMYVNGKFAPTIGNICMDLTMLDVTDVECEEGDTVIIFGEEQPPIVLAQQLETIPYEILTSVSERVKRVYVSE